MDQAPRIRAALDVDFEDSSAPQLVTALLTLHVPELDADALWALSVGDRIHALLAILGRAYEGPLWVERRCANEACGEPIEIDVSPAELVALAGSGADERIAVEHGGRTLEVRRPTGRDQVAWQRRGFADEDDALRSVARDLVLGGAELELDDGLVAAVDDALREADPLVCLELSVACPYCRAVRCYELDVLELALDWFRERQAALIADVHALALRYHWTEAEILAVPGARRARYLELIELGRG